MTNIFPTTCVVNTTMQRTKPNNSLNKNNNNITRINIITQNLVICCINLRTLFNRKI